MNVSATRIIKKILKITGITLGSILLVMFLLPYLFPGFVSTQIKQWARSSIKSELNFSKARLSFFKHFPSLTLTLYDFSLHGSAPFAKDTLISSEEIALGVDVSSVFASRININKVFLTRAFVNVEVDSNGLANYNVYDSKPGKKTDTSTSTASLKIENIEIEESRLIYNDNSIPLKLFARGFNYKGNGDLSKAIFDLQSHMEIDSMDFYYDGVPYFLYKKLNADLVTKINTHSLALIFEKNNIKINQLPVEFNGSFEFLKNGYQMDFSLSSKATDLHDVFTALPPSMLGWVTNTEIRGKTEIYATLAGKYIAAEGEMPDFDLKMNVRDGYISNAKAPVPVKNLYLNLEARIPQFETDSLQLNIDSIYFALDKGYFSSFLRMKGMREPDLLARLHTQIDLEKLGTALGFEKMQFKGEFDAEGFAEGRYATAIRKQGVRKTDTVISSIPRFHFLGNLKNGYVKYASLPQAVHDIRFRVSANCPDHDYTHTSASIENIHAEVLQNLLHGYLKLENAKNFPVDADLKAQLNLADVKSFYPLDSMQLAGNVAVDLKSKGNYLPEKKIFPVTTATVLMQNGSVKTKYYPHPVEDIQVDAALTNTSGNFSGMQINLKPVSFRFEGQPFLLKAGFQNFNNIHYTIVSNGTLDLGKLYQAFALPGYSVTGWLHTDISLSGLQSDAQAGHYDRLSNTGSIRVKDLVFNSDLFPQPFRLKTGVFHFDQDKLMFDECKAGYGKSDLSAKGYLSNLVNYATQKNAKLSGQIDLNSRAIYVDEFMAYAPPVKANGNAQPDTAAVTGVAMVPGNLALTINATAGKIYYNGIQLDSFSGKMLIDSGQLSLQKTGFTLIGAPVVMDLIYKSLNPKRATFNYHLSANAFDIKKAYNSIRIFHDLASAAAKAEGIVSLDYALAGRLDEKMHPVFPSLTGGGVLTLQKIKVKGLKLFSAVSKETDKDIRDPDLSKVEIKSSIKNNLITIERTRMKVAGFRPRFEGQVSFDGKLNLKFRLGLPPFGVIGIPMTITGTQENPKVKLGRGKKDGGLQETEDKDESEND